MVSRSSSDPPMRRRVSLGPHPKGEAFVEFDARSKTLAYETVDQSGVVTDRVILSVANLRLLGPEMSEFVAAHQAKEAKA